MEEWLWRSSSWLVGVRWNICFSVWLITFFSLFELSLMMCHSPAFTSTTVHTRPIQQLNHTLHRNNSSNQNKCCLLCTTHSSSIQCQLNVRIVATKLGDVDFEYGIKLCWHKIQSSISTEIFLFYSRK